MAYPKIEKRANELAEKINTLWIAANKPTYLIPSEGEKAFIESLPAEQKEALLRALELCNQEIEYLETVGAKGKGYGKTTIAKCLQPIYRKAITQLTGVKQYRSLPICLFTYNQTKVVNDSYKAKVDRKTEELIPVTVTQLEQWKRKAVEFIHCEDDNQAGLVKRVLGVAMLTGRRVYKEVCLQGSFMPVLDESGKVKPDELIFFGQAKGGVEKKEDGYNITTLYDARLIYEAQMKIVEEIKAKPYYVKLLSDLTTLDGEDSKTIKSNLHGYIERISYVELTPIFKDTTAKGYRLNLSAHDGRKLYATICHHDYVQRTGKAISFEDYVSRLLGHSRKSKLGNEFKDTVTSRAYHKYAVIQGNAIPDKSLFWS